MTAVIAGIDDVQIGDVITPVTIRLTTQRLVMEAAASRSFTPIHHDRAAARAAGAPAATASVIFIQGLFEMTLRQWMGPAGRLRRLSVRLGGFACAGDSVTCSGEVVEMDTAAGSVHVELHQRTGRGDTAIAIAVVGLPHRC